MRVMISKLYVGLLLTLSLLTGCAGLSSSIDRHIASDRLAKSFEFEKSFLKTKYFTLTTYYRLKNSGEPLTVYIEGDGNAWSGRTRLSDDPTPGNPLMLELAGQDASANVAYLARPGQYPESGFPDCEPTYWSDRRFSEEVIASMGEAIDELALRAKTNKINLIGYSGGAAVAVLIASQRRDITSLRTIAGNLDSEALNRYHHVSPLTGSLNPVDVADQIKDLPQRHFIGSKDKIVPLLITQSFVGRMGDKDYKRITVIEGATHTKGWQERWKELLFEPIIGAGE